MADLGRRQRAVNPRRLPRSTIGDGGPGQPPAGLNPRRLPRSVIGDGGPGQAAAGLNPHRLPWSTIKAWISLTWTKSSPDVLVSGVINARVFPHLEGFRNLEKGLRPGISSILPHKEQRDKVQEEHFAHNPEPESIYRFIHPFFIAIRVTAGYAISTLVYIERLLIYAEIDICPTNWKRIILGAIVLAFKYWHDLNISNSIFCQIRRDVAVKDLNELERQYFYLLQFGLNIPLSVYAKYYFDLRSLASDHGLPTAFAPLRKERALTLEAISRYCENKNLCRVAIKKSGSCDKLTDMQHADAILS
ncbi:hypothetical protein QTO34_008056 [Cnephaeus nilssonii]|uniref:Cyclin N-terminal domain-containing protein n=1 Tax=Cnephaeus nilssonii TaxID=3371016 RepID=A0AA40I9J1_CNENI|nr:hypothetical protein QTO34_008056 [Eptesicus nilssonii]